MTAELPPAFEAFLGDLLEPANEDKYLGHLVSYMDRGGYTGAAFGQLTMEGADPDRVDVSDLAALWTLSVPLQYRQSYELLVTRADELASNLAAMPDRPLAELSSAEVDEMHEPGAPAMRLWRLLTDIDDIGSVRASKLLARKRPNLIPIFDSFIQSVLGLKSDAEQWRQFHEALSRNDREVESRLLELGGRAGHPELSALRVFDILVWMHQRLRRSEVAS